MSVLALFVAAFVAATLWPLGSEVLYAGLVHRFPERTALYWFVATIGNTLGAVLMLAIARWLSDRVTHRWTDRFQPSERARALLDRFGAPLLFFAWLPVVGDLLPVAAGWLKLRLWWCSVWIALGKGARFALLALLLT